MRRLLRRLLGRLPPRRAPVRLRLVTKRDCGLCDGMKAELARLSTDVPFVLEEVDLHSDPELADRYALSVPVLEVEGRPAFEGRLTAEALAERLAREPRREEEA